MDTQQKIEQRREDARKRQKQLKKRANSKINYKLRNGILTAVVAVVSVVLLFALIFPNTSLSHRVFTAVTIGDEKISSAEYSYYYRNAYSNYYQTMASYVGAANIPIDTSKSLKKQQMSDGMSYADYFSSNAIDTLTRLIALSNEAKAAGFVLPPEYKQQYNTVISNLETAAAQAGVSVDKYLASYYGKGFNEAMFKKCANRELLASAWVEYKMAEPTYTDEQLEAYYQEHRDTYDTVDFRMVSYKEVAATDENEGMTVEEAKAAAEEFLEKAVDTETFTEMAITKYAEDNNLEVEDVTDSSYVQNVTHASAMAIDTNLTDWLFSDERTSGEKAVIESATGTTFYVVWIEKPASRQDQNTISVRHILFYVEAGSDEETKAQAEAQAEEVYNQFIQGGATEELFAELANQYSYDTGSNTNGGLYENVYPGDMLEEFDAWCFDPERQPGNTGIVETQVGYHIMYFVGQGDAKWAVDVEATLRDADYNAYFDALIATYESKTHWLGMQFRTEPF